MTEQDKVMLMRLSLGGKHVALIPSCTRNEIQILVDGKEVLSLNDDAITLLVDALYTTRRSLHCT